MVNPAARFEIFKLKLFAAIVDGLHVMDDCRRHGAPFPATADTKPTISPLRRSRRAPPGGRLIELLCLTPIQNGVLEIVIAGVLPARAKAPAARVRAAATSSLLSLFLVRLMSRTLP